MIDYTYAEYKFEFAVWAAGNAARMGAGIWLTNEKVCEILKTTGFYEIAEKGIEGLPDPEGFDAKHRDWRNKILKEVRKEAERLEKEDWSHGKAAKLINVFIKALMPADLKSLSDGEKEKWYAVHPPIDKNVLTGMMCDGFGYRYKDWISLPGTKGKPDGIPKWTKFKCNDYENVIDMIRDDLRKCGEKDPLPLWKNERFFKLC